MEAPKPSSALFEAAAELSAKQRDVLEALQNAPDGARVTELASTLGMHVNTVRGHLDELLSQGVISRTVNHVQGRGRPSHTFHVRTPRHSAVADEQAALIKVLLDAAVGDDLAAARALGRSWAQQSPIDANELSFEQLAQAVMAFLHDMGFDPAVREAASTPDSLEVGLHACPFVQGDGTPPPAAVCELHRGFLEATIGEHELGFMPFDKPGECGARISRSTNRSD